jgi:hypothetical protein
MDSVAPKIVLLLCYCSHFKQIQIVRQLSGSCQAVVRQLSGSCLAVIKQSSDRQAVDEKMNQWFRGPRKKVDLVNR